MTSCEQVFKDVSSIYSRLFNHRAALQGLGNNFVKEFEGKRGDREPIYLSRTLEVITDCRDRSFPWLAEQFDQHLGMLQQEAAKASDQCCAILKNEEEKSEWLETQRARRDQEWKEFMETQLLRSSRVDQEFGNVVETLHSHYTELEEKVGGGNKAVL